jgi:hypothetical protein
MKDFRVYKPRNKDEGVALRLQFRVKPRKGKSFEEPMIFAEMAKQTGVDENGNATFDWAAPKDGGVKNCTMNLGIPDVCELLLVLRGMKEQVGPPGKDGKPGMGLFHKNTSGNTVMRFVSTQSGYAMQLSTSRENSYKIGLTAAEGLCMEILLTKFIEVYYGWEGE